LRLLQALGGGVAVVNVGAIVGDRFDAMDSARVFTTIAFITMTAPLVAPLIGAALLEAFAWPAVFVLLAVYALGGLAIVIWKIPETVIFDGKRQAIGAVVKQSLRAFGEVLGSGPAIGFTLCSGLAMGSMFVFLNDAAFLSMDWSGSARAGFRSFAARTSPR
jgi:DHA1 family bicyclomycin/chloramphenicol resistance-like MFS transporter